MSKSKKVGKTAKLPQPIKLKKEKVEEDRALHSMAHFVDDRVELVKQIFGSLKTKTILNLAPEYLKEKDMDETQELCLNELLCLSKKRLLSIINATKCPTDTESSEDSDVEAKDEHISLEEISSGSELENGDKSAKKTALHSRVKRNSKKTTNAADNKNGNDGQMSVLELLELQARARAIRSQLALEPVTKIEVDLDDDDPTPPTENVSSTTKDQNANRKRKKQTNNVTDKSSSASASSQKNQQNTTQDTTTTTTTTTATTTSSSNISKQKIKLKRNFRKQNQDSIEADSSEQELQSKQQKIKKEKEKGDRSPSPDDVIPIVPEPETLCISDSDTEAEKVRRKETRLKQQQQQSKTNEEAEDGEIVETIENTEKAANSMENSNIAMKNESLPPQCDTNKDENVGGNKVTILDDQIIKDISKNAAEDHKTADDGNNKNGEECYEISAPEHDIDGDHNDDIISLEGGDLETEMSEHLDQGNSSNRNFSDERPTDMAKKKKKEKAEEQEEQKQEEKERNDIISLESSENEDGCMDSNNAESWHARYLKSSKVSKVLAVSRLGKRVRDKLKTSKISKREQIQNDNAKNEETNNFKSKHEDGSMEQYKEILEMSHRKS